MFQFSYPAKFKPGGEGRVMVEFVDLARVATDGKDEREAMEEAMDALGSDLSIRLSRREQIPKPSAAKRRQRLVPVPLWLTPKLALYLAIIATFSELFSIGRAGKLATHTYNGSIQGGPNI